MNNSRNTLTAALAAIMLIGAASISTPASARERRGYEGGWSHHDCCRHYSRGRHYDWRREASWGYSGMAFENMSGCKYYGSAYYTGCGPTGKIYPDYVYGPAIRAAF